MFLYIMSIRTIINLCVHDLYDNDLQRLPFAACMFTTCPLLEEWKYISREATDMLKVPHVRECTQAHRALDM